MAENSVISMLFPTLPATPFDLSEFPHRFSNKVSSGSGFC